MPNSNDIPKVAIYWDFENIHACLCDRQFGGGEYFRNRFRPQEAVVDIDAVLDYASTIGDVVVHKAYCNWQFYGKYQESLNRAGMDLIQIFPRGWNAKNGADISLALDALTDVQQHPHITHVVIISNDTDFVSLAQKIKQGGRTIVGIGLPVANRFWQSSCNEFRLYDTLVELANPPEPAIPHPDPVTNSFETEAVQEPVEGTLTIESARNLLIKAMRHLIDRNGENYVAKAGLKTLIKRLDPAFDEKALGFANFSGFLKHFSDLVTTVDAESGGHVALVEAPLAPEVPTPSPNPDLESEMPAGNPEMPPSEAEGLPAKEGTQIGEEPIENDH